MIWMGPESYDDDAKRWLASAGHYLDNPPPGCLFAVGVRRGVEGLFAEVVPQGPLLGLCVVGRPVARELPQDGTWGEITRFVLLEGLPYATASALLRRTWEIGRVRRAPGLETVIAYHDRTRHTGCIYRKAGMRKDIACAARARVGWGNRTARTSARYAGTPKRRWRIDLQRMEVST